MTWNSGPCLDSVPETVTAALDAINARLGWPRRRPEPCAGHMVHEHQPVDGIDVTIDATRVEVSVAELVVGVGDRWGGIGNAAVRCILPHASTPHSPYVSALHQGGALNAFAHHLLVTHGTHSYACCASWSTRDRWCRICREGAL